MNWETTLKKINHETALRAASLWVTQPIHLKLVNNQINCVYRFEDKNRGYYLRITHETIRSRPELEAAIDFQQHLFKHHAPICQPIPSETGAYIEIIKQDHLEFFAHVCLEVPGKIMSFENTNKQAYFTWGKALAQLHNAAQSYQPQIHHFLSWKDLWQETHEYLQQEPQEIQDCFHRIETFFNQNTTTALNFGLTHGDHRPGNVLYDGQQIHIIDFDEPVYHWFLADIAKPFLDLCNQPRESWMPLFNRYIEGYRSTRPITENDLKNIRWFTQMKSLEIYLWCKNNWHEPTAPGGKPRELWLSELRQMAMTPLF